MPKMVSFSPPMEAAAGVTPNAAIYDIEQALLAAPEFMAHLGIDKEWVEPTLHRLVGAGYFAAVYPLPDESKVLKVTEDPQDASAAKLILDAGGQVRGLVGVFDVVALPTDYLGHYPSGAKIGGERKFWGIVAERVRPRKRGDKQVPSLLRLAKTALRDESYWDEESLARLTAAMRRTASSRAPGQADLAAGWLWLHDRGVNVGDLHDGNVGWSDARQQAVLLDLGFAEGPGPEVRTVKNPTPNRATVPDIRQALLRAPNFLASLGLSDEADLTDVLKIPLGQGHYAYAFALPNGMVLKVTDDEDDARVCKMILESGNGLPGLPYIQSVHRLPGTVYEHETDEDEERPIFAIVMESVTPASKVFGGMRPRLLGEVVLYPSMESELPSDAAREFARKIRRGIHWLAAHGVSVVDLHHNNFGYASGKRPVIIDFGHGSLQDEFEMTPIAVAANPRVDVESRPAAFKRLRAANARCAAALKRIDTKLGVGDITKALAMAESSEQGRQILAEYHSRMSKLSPENAARREQIIREWEDTIDEAYDMHENPEAMAKTGLASNGPALVVEGRQRPISEMIGGKFYHGSPHELSVGTILEPGRAARNYKQSKSVGVSITSDIARAAQWGGLEGKARGYVYEVEPLGDVEVHRAGPANYGKNFILWEGLVPRARIVAIVRGDELAPNAGSKSPTYPGCKKTPVAQGHVKGEPWTCRACGKEACARCVKYFWTAKGGTVDFRTGGAPQMVGERVATCPTCAVAKTGLKPNGRHMPHVRAVFDECFDVLTEQFPDFGELELHQDEKAGGDNGHGSERQFGYCMDGKPIRIAFATKTDDLPEANIRGLMAHEFGHALDYRYGDKLGKMLGQRLPAGVERRADSIAKAVFGKTIKYDDRDIQCVACQGKNARPRRLGP